MSDNKQEFDNYAQTYAELLKDPVRDAFAPGSAFFAERKWILLEHMLRSQGRDARQMSWLDVGCGQGDLLRLGAPSMHNVAGCDVSAEMLASCRDLPTRVQTDPLQIPYDDASFDLVTAVCVYHHVPAESRDQLTTEISRVLRPNGLFCIIEHNPFNPMTQLIVSRTPVDQDAHLLTAGKSARLIKRAGLREVAREYFLYLPESLYRKLPMMESILRRVPAGGQYALTGQKTA